MTINYWNECGTVSLVKLWVNWYTGNYRNFYMNDPMLTLLHAIIKFSEFCSDSDSLFHPRTDIQFWECITPAKIRLKLWQMWKSHETFLARENTLPL